MAGQREIVGIIETAMLLRNDVFDVMEQFTMPLVKRTIFATLASPFTDELPRPASIATEGFGPDAVWP
jgi:hypothetical protein